LLLFWSVTDSDLSKAFDRVIILFGWINAPLHLLQKYALQHRLNWPSSDIIIVRSFVSWIWWSEKTRVDILRPVADFLISTVYNCIADVSNNAPGILIHCMSNGGGWHLMTLSKMLFQSDSLAVRTGRNIRLAMVFDSVPGIGEYRSLFVFSSQGVESGAIKAALTIPSFLIWIYLFTRAIVSREETLLTRLHSALQVDQLLPRTEHQAPRVYIYSATDILSQAHSVERHLAVLKKANPPFDIEVEKFARSRHVSHAQTDPERYWDAMRRVWDRSALSNAKL
ncbi:hypothetical protein R3P38DRAFT_3546904, partial [Favolaschia claudopus]